VKRLIILSLIACFIFPIYGNCKSDTLKTVHRITLKSGIYKYYKRDLVYSPMIYKGISVPISLEYFNSKSKRMHSFNLLYDNTVLSSSITERNNTTNEYLSNYFDAINFKIRYAYLTHIREYSKWKIYLGGSLRSFNLFENHHLDEGNTQTFAFDIFTDLNFDINLTRLVNEKNLLKLEFSCALLSYVLARIYAPELIPEKLDISDDNVTLLDVLKSGDFLTINKFYDYNFNATYFYSINKKVDLYSGYAFQYYQYPKLFMVKNGMHNFLVGLTLKL
jgi:hypothetical protein